MRIAVIGGGISGLACAQILNGRAKVRVFERESRPGGLVRCERIGGSLFHLCGGHVFNTKNADVSKWFWSRFDRDRDFTKANRKSAVCLPDGRFVGYPIENHVYQLDDSIQNGFYADIDEMMKNPAPPPSCFGEFLRRRFGRTLYNLYFGPYNAKVWRSNLDEIPLDWLEDKLPMPTPEEMLEANHVHLEEKGLVHSSFYYPRNGGSQFIADKLAEGLNIVYGASITKISVLDNGLYSVNGEIFDAVVFCGNVKDMPAMMTGSNVIPDYLCDEIARLESHGTTAVFCETDPIAYSWFYQPSAAHHSHRFICTGNFSASNNTPGKMTCTVEFTDFISEDDIKRELDLMPYHPRYRTHHYSPCTYPIQHSGTRNMIRRLKSVLADRNIYLCGRFAEWEYFNMDAAIASAMKVTNGSILPNLSQNDYSGDINGRLTC